MEALREAKKQKITGFIASEGWCTRFMRRDLYSIQEPTKIAQRLPKHYVDNIINFQRFVIRHRRQHNYQLSCIGNMDEYLVYMEMLPHKTMNKKGASTVLIKSTGHEQSRYTVVLALMADGKKLPPMIIFKRKTKPPGNFPKGVKIHFNEKGWMDASSCELWTHSIWQHRPGGLHKQKSLLVGINSASI